MPTYEYACRECGHTFEVVQKMSDDPLSTCPRCEGSLRKVFAPPAIAFKGSGFYATDHGRKKKDRGESSEGGAKAGASDGASDGGKSGGTASGKDGGGGAKPATTGTAGSGSTSSTGSGGGSSSGSKAKSGGSSKGASSS